MGLRFNTIGVSDGISMGTEGMCYSLQSRDIIADSVETVMAAQWCARASATRTGRHMESMMREEAGASGSRRAASGEMTSGLSRASSGGASSTRSSRVGSFF